MDSSSLVVVAIALLSACSSSTTQEDTRQRGSRTDLPSSGGVTAYANAAEKLSKGSAVVARSQYFAGHVGSSIAEWIAIATVERCDSNGAVLAVETSLVGEGEQVVDLAKVSCLPSGRDQESNQDTGFVPEKRLVVFLSRRDGRWYPSETSLPAGGLDTEAVMHLSALAQVSRLESKQQLSVASAWLKSEDPHIAEAAVRWLREEVTRIPVTKQDLFIGRGAFHAARGKQLERISGAGWSWEAVVGELGDFVRTANDTVLRAEALRLIHDLGGFLPSHEDFEGSMELAVAAVEDSEPAVARAAHARLRTVVNRWLPQGDLGWLRRVRTEAELRADMPRIRLEWAQWADRGGIQALTERAESELSLPIAPTVEEISEAFRRPESGITECWTEQALAQTVGVRLNYRVQPSGEVRLLGVEPTEGASKGLLRCVRKRIESVRVSRSQRGRSRSVTFRPARTLRL